MPSVKGSVHHYVPQYHLLGIVLTVTIQDIQRER